MIRNGSILGCQGRVQDRYSGRKERRPGRRERHSGQTGRFQLTTKHFEQEKVNDSVQQQSKSVRVISSKTRNSENKGNSRVRQKEEQADQDEETVSQYRECSTLEDIKKEMNSRPSLPEPSHLPNWMMSLDMNLDVTSVDVIPPFEMARRPSTSLSYSMPVKLTELRDDNFETASLPEFEVVSQHAKENYETRQSVDPVNTPGKQIKRTFRATSAGPRRYQGDKRVMSMQTGGIRSTPMQPSAKKFINQMITYRHMKHHDTKLRKAKPAVDTKMPATFKIALNRKKLIEERLTDSWNTSYSTSLPSNRSAASPIMSRSSPMFTSGSPHKTASSTLDLTLTASQSDEKSTVQSPTRQSPTVLSPTRRKKSSTPIQPEQHASPSPQRSRGSPTRSRPTSLAR